MPLVPVDGLYEFTAHCMRNQVNIGGCRMNVKGVDVAEAYTRQDTESDTSTELSIVLELTTGQTVYVTNRVTLSLHGSNTSVMFSWFTGYLIKPY